MAGILSKLALLILLGINPTFAQGTGSGTLIDPVTRFSNLSLTLPPYSPGVILQTDFDQAPDCGETSYKGLGRLQGLRALITGGDSGIGRAVAIAYAREGANVTINYLPDEEPDAQDLVDVMAREGVTIERIPGDLRNESFCTALVEEAHSLMGGLDILVSNAGYSGPIAGPFSQAISNISTAQIVRTFETNVFAGFYLSRAAIPLLPPGGSIIFTTSGTVSNPGSGGTAYGASKAAIVYMTQSIALAVASVGIRVNAIAPAILYSPLLAESGFTTQILAGIGPSQPLGRIEQPVELSPLYVDLAAPDHTYVSGEVYSAKGGAKGL